MPHDKSRGGRETRKPKKAAKAKTGTASTTSAVSTAVHPTAPHPTHAPK